MPPQETRQKKRIPSIRLYIFCFVGFGILFCIILLSYILQRNMSQMPRQGERQTIQETVNSDNTPWADIERAVGLMQIVLLVCGVCLIFVIEWFLIRPLDHLGLELKSFDTLKSSVDIEQYKSSREVYNLSTYLNDMLGRLGESKQIAEETVTSLNIMQSILNAMDGFLYVTDAETNEILFINEPMKKHYGLQGDMTGKICWQYLQSDMERECEFCPMKELRQNPDIPVTWEEHSTATDRYYKNVDCMIEWWDKSKVHMQHSTDITYIRQAEAELQRRLEREQFISAVSQSFISNEDIDILIKNALVMIGEFLKADRIYLTAYDDEEKLLAYKDDRQYTKPGIVSIDRHSRTFKQGDIVYDKIAEHLTLAVNDVMGQPEYQTGQMEDVRSFLAVPICVSGNTWGALNVDFCTEAHEWSEGDIYLVALFVGMLSGVLDRQIVGERLFNTNQIMRTILENAPVGIHWKDMNRRYMGCNAYFEEFIGLTEGEIIDRTALDIFPEEIANTHNQADDPILNGRQVRVSYDAPLSNKDNQIRWIHVNKVIIYNEKKEKLCILSVFDDITEQKELNRKLVEAKEAAEQASRSKSHFLSRMSHEIRTPMNAIIGMTVIAKNTKNMEKKEDCLDKIDNASKHLLSVINDILDMSKIEADKFELSVGKVDIEKMLINIVNVVNFRVEEKNQTFIVNMHKSVPPFIMGDELRLSQVITNLLANAVKFTPNNGRIILSVDKIREEGGNVTLLIEVEDNGIGVSEEQKSRLFTLFEQADGSISREYGGTGLGLAISKNIIEMMGGEIWVESRLGQGSKFIFTIEVKKLEGDSENVLAAGIKSNNIHVLAVDDCAEIREFFLSVMESFELPCDVAADGFEALKKLEENRENPYNIIFVDWKMPYLNGIELTKKIKEMVDHNTVVIMISASEWIEIEEEALAAGVNCFVSKPLFPSILVNIINKIMGVAPKEVLKIKKPRGHLLKNRRILLVEDVDINREIILALLEDEGIFVECADNGAIAVSMFAAKSDYYDLILMDIHMPEMDGYQATGAIRSLNTRKAKEIPIIAMTANVFQEDIEKCLAAGMNAHVGKPINQDELIEKLSIYLKPVEAEQEEDSVMMKKTPADIDYNEFLPIIDVEDGIKRLLNNKRLYFNLLKNFSGRKMTDELVKNIEENNLSDAAQTAHALKGAAMNLGLVQLAEVAANIESRAKNKLDSVRLIKDLDDASCAVADSIGRLLESEGLK